MKVQRELVDLDELYLYALDDDGFDHDRGGRHEVDGNWRRKCLEFRDFLKAHNYFREQVLIGKGRAHTLKSSNNLRDDWLRVSHTKIDQN